MQIQMKCFKMILEGWVIGLSNHPLYVGETLYFVPMDIRSDYHRYVCPMDLWGVCIAGFSSFGLETLKFKRVVGLQAPFLLSMCCWIFDRIDGHLFGLCKWVTQGGIAAPVTSI